MESQPLRKLLIVDDDPDVLTIARYSLKKDQTLEVRCASSGEDGLTIAKNFMPDLILLDVMMPKLDGITTLEHLRNQKETKNIPVVFFTAKVTQEEINFYTKQDVIAVLVKPFDPLKFLDSIQAIWHKYVLGRR